MSNPNIFTYTHNCSDWAQNGPSLEQSPIDLNPSQCVHPDPKSLQMTFSLNDAPLSNLIIDDIGTTLMSHGAFSHLKATDLYGFTYEYEAVQLHFHAPTEHTINGRYYDLELHIVHQMTKEFQARNVGHRDFAVVGMMFEVDEKMGAKGSDFIEALKLNKVGSQLNINMYETLGRELGDVAPFFAYKGSLTTPPCTECVNWYVVEKPLKISKRQLEHFDKRWKDNVEFACGHGNNRPLQALNGRIVIRSEEGHVTSLSRHAEVRKELEVVENVGKLQISCESGKKNDDLHKKHSVLGRSNKKHKENFAESTHAPHKVCVQRRLF